MSFIDNKEEVTYLFQAVAPMVNNMMYRSLGYVPKGGCAMSEAKRQKARKARKKKNKR